MLGAVGDIAAFGMTQASKALIRKIVEEKHKDRLSPESRQIIERLKTGSGIKRF
jgi:poly-beta-hydroxyalkanoate depolymerase